MTDGLFLSDQQSHDVPQDAAVVDLAALEVIVRATLPAGFLACAIAIVTGVVSRELWLVAVSAPGAAGFLLAYPLMRRRAVRAAALTVVITAGMLVGVSAAIGAGIRDVGVLAYPVILIFAGMTLSRRGLILSLSFIAASMVFLAANQLLGLVPLHTQDNPPWVDVIIVSVIMGATMYSVWVLSESARHGLAVARAEIELRRCAENELKLLSMYDSLTGVYNRRFFDAEMRRLEASRSPLVSVITADVDDLKAVNDEFGHAAGDELIIRAAALLGSVVRAEDVLARIGGDEFAILLPGTDAAAVDRAIARIEANIVEDSRRNPGSPISLSIGAATAAALDVGATLALADSRMYARKAARKSGIVPEREGASPQRAAGTQPAT